MRKKSHISLAGFLVKGLENDVLSRRWKAFYVGSLLPDCRPSFLTVRHEYDETFEMVENKIRRLIEQQGKFQQDSMRFMIDLGQVFHYIADYFTFPHNSHYPGNLKDHCVYEEYLKLELRSYIREGNAVFHSEGAKRLTSVEDILSYIKRSHAEYMKKLHSVEEDCEYITRVCSQVLTAMSRLMDAPVLAYAA
ncbi:MAG: zinc dependent phospholipase C family protein [Clostridiales bacterium]|nr:zinc dependent phospholipase C family protein [Clostridiales bacterium]